MTGSTAIPTLRYRDAPRMIDWLCETFGFERHAVHEDGAGGIAHAQLTLGTGMVMLGSAREDDYGAHHAPPDGGRPATAAACLVVPDVDAVHDRAVAAGGVPVIAPRDEDHGGRGCVIRDPEGGLWSVGSYDPWS